MTPELVPHTDSVVFFFLVSHTIPLVDMQAARHAGGGGGGDRGRGARGQLAAIARVQRSVQEPAISRERRSVLSVARLCVWLTHGCMDASVKNMEEASAVNLPAPPPPQVARSARRCRDRSAPRSAQSAPEDRPVACWRLARAAQPRGPTSNYVLAGHNGCPEMDGSVDNPE